MFGLLAYVAGLINDLAASLLGAVVPSGDGSRDNADSAAARVNGDSPAGATGPGDEASIASTWGAANDNAAQPALSPTSAASLIPAAESTGEDAGASGYALASFEDDAFESINFAGSAVPEPDMPVDFDNSLFEAFGALQRANALFAGSNDDVQLLSAHEYFERASAAGSSDLPFS